MTIKAWPGLAAGLTLGALTHTAMAQDALVTTARGLQAKFKDALVSVRLTAKVRTFYQGREQSGPESTMEISGTVLTPGGLTVISDVTSSPSGPFPGMSGGPKVETETTDTKLVLRDGREIPARFVLRDKDLDLAFVMPEEKGLNLPHVSLVKSQVVEPLDDLIYLFTLGKTHSREAALALGKVQAVVKKPRVFLVSDFIMGLRALGCPAFNAKGDAIGLLVLRRPPGMAGGPESLREVMDLMNPVVLTADDVLEVAAQAEKAAAAPTPTPAATPARGAQPSPTIKK